jgi:glycosyltransferase involved in cell wall biosynthesis
LKKLVSICVPCRNEFGNVEPMAIEIINQMNTIPQFDYEIIFIDNHSTDGTPDILRKLCAEDKRVKAILNARNFPEGSGMHVLFQASGDCIISIPADFQVPVELIPKMIKEWENGCAVVALTKIPGKKDKVRGFRKLYYALSKRLSNQDVLVGFTGSGLYDKSFIDMCKTRNDPMLSIRYMVANYSASLKKLEYNEKPRRSGVSNHSTGAMVNIAITRFLRVSDNAPRFAILSGMIMGAGSLLIAIYYLVRKLIDWYNFPVGMAPLVIGVFFLGAIQLIFLGILGEYILMINKRQKNEPRVVEQERINFTDK